MEISLYCKSVLDTFDRQPYAKCQEMEVSNAIQANLPARQWTAAETAELMAFQFRENYKRNEQESVLWFFRFDRIRTYNNEIEIYPEIADITPEVLLYWTNRSNNAKHPVLVARYAGLVHEFTRLVTKKSPDHTTTRRFADALLLTVEADLCPVRLYAIDKLRKALRIAVSYKFDDLVTRIKEFTLAYEKKVPYTETRNYWGFSFDWLVEDHKKLVTELEIDQIISELEKRYETLLGLEFEPAKEAALRLAKYYHVKNDSINTKRILLSLEQAMETKNANTSAMQVVHDLEEMHKHFRKHGCKTEAENTLIRMRSASADLDKEFKSITGSGKMSREQIETYISSFTKENPANFIRKIVTAHIPSIADAESALDLRVKSSGLRFRLSTDLLDYKGRKTATIKPIDQEKEGHLVQQYDFEIKYKSLLLDFVIREAYLRGIITVSQVMLFLSGTLIVDKSRLLIIERGLEAYFREDYIVFLHLVVPQIEEAVRNLLESKGGNVLVAKDDTFMLKTFETLLKDPIVISELGEANSFYFRVLFTDKRGINLRNNLAHGMMEMSRFDEIHANAVFLALLNLGLIGT